MKSAALILSALLGHAIAAPAGQIVHERRAVQEGLHIVKDLDADTKLPVRIALKQPNLDKGADHLLEISNPKSKNYGKHLSKEDIIKMFAVDDSKIESVKKWLEKVGISADTIKVPASKNWVTFTTTAGQLEHILNAKYHVYSSDNSDKTLIGTDEYHVPTDLSPIIDFVSPGVAVNRKISGHSAKLPYKPVPQKVLDALKVDSRSLANCDSSITPDCIRAMYNIPNATYSDSSNHLGVFESLGERYLQSDFDKFYNIAATNVPKGTGPVVDSINGANAHAQPGQGGGETTMDFELAIPLIHPQKTELYQVPEDYNEDIFDQFFDAVDGSYCSEESGDCGAFTSANVLSFSYGGDENGDTISHYKRQCNEFMKLGLQGVTTVVSSGDSGVASRQQRCLGESHNIFIPSNPSTCPYVLSVGSTNLPSGSQPGDDEISTVEFSSGGGFSNVYKTPDYQKQAVSTYFSKHDPGYKSYTTSDSITPPKGTKGIYNRAGRGYPDVSAVGINGLIVVNGKTSNNGGGTSMSAPIVASIINLINEERIHAGKSPVGFVNPVIYQHPEAFNDVTVGNQAKGGQFGDGQPSECGNKGFSSVEGWDPVSGLGTPNYKKLLDVFMKI